MFHTRMVLRPCFLILLSLLAGTLHAQVNFNWAEQGPDNQGGIIRALAWGPGGALYAGSAGGGLWRTSDGGASWQEVAAFNRDAPDRNLAVTSIAADGDVMMVGTGEFLYYRDPGYSYDLIKTLNTSRDGYAGHVGTFGGGLFVSTDGGATWSRKLVLGAFPEIPYDVTENNEDGRYLAISKVATKGGRSFAGTFRGLVRSDNNFASGTYVYRSSDASDASAPADFDPDLHGLQIAPIFDIEFGQEGYVYVATDKFVFISSDNGNTFSTIVGYERLPRDPSCANLARCLPGQAKGRMEIAIAPQNPLKVYVAEIGQNGFLHGIWKNESAGTSGSWTSVAPATSVSASALGAFAPTEEKPGTTGGRGVYSFALQVDPDTEDGLLLGSQTLWKYTPATGWVNRTTSFQIFRNNELYVPAGIHQFLAHPVDGNFYYIATDLGVFRTATGGSTYEFSSYNLRASFVGSVAATTREGLIGITRNAGVVHRDGPSAFENGSRYAAGEFRSEIASYTQVQKRGQVKTSILNSDYSLVTGTGGEALRSLNNADTYERFFGANGDIKPFTSGSQSSADSIGYNDNLINLTPIELDELPDLSHPQFGDTIVGQDNAAKYPSYVYAATKNNVWLVTNPFGSSGSAIPRWTRIIPNMQDSELATALSVSHDNTHTLYIGTKSGMILRVKNAHNPCANYETNPGGCSTGFEYDTISNGSSLPKRWISSIAVHPEDPNRIVITYGSLPASDTVLADNPNRHNIYYSSNAMGANPTFKSIHNIGTLPFVPVYAAMWNPANPDAWLMVGTDYGIFYTTDDLDSENYQTITWTEGNDGAMRRVPVYSLSYNPYKEIVETNSSTGARWVRLQKNDCALIYAGTMGRGIIASDAVATNSSVTSCIPVSVQQPLEARKAALAVYPNPASTAATLHLADAAAGIWTVEMADMTGRVLLRTTVSGADLAAGFRLNLEQMPAGILLLKAASPAGALHTSRVAVAR